MPGDQIEVEINGSLADMRILKADKTTVSFAEVIRTLEEYGQKEQRLEKSFRIATGRNDQAAIDKLREQYFALQDEKRAKLTELAEKNTDNLTAAVILQTLVHDPDADMMRLKKIYDNLAPEVKSSNYARKAWDKLQKELVTAVGQKAPDFAAPTPEGDTLRMSDVLKNSKVLIIDFWASWCKPCRVENPYVVEIYKKYHDKGLNIIGVSLDKPGDRDKWLKAIKDDQLDWYHVSNLQFWQDPVARLYGINSIPATLILDKDGVIRAKNLRRQRLENKIKELLNE
ncbi:MAG: TlpA family protein disulfide reductase [Chlorobi bacterium]|nr:TlpA family protein disulfide reductase [Chlorobiota bacterium]